MSQGKMTTVYSYLCPTVIGIAFYRILVHDRCHRMSRCMQIFLAVKLLCSGMREKGHFIVYAGFQLVLSLCSSATRYSTAKIQLALFAMASDSTVELKMERVRFSETAVRQPASRKFIYITVGYLKILIK